MTRTEYKSLVKAFRNLLSGEDDELSTAYAQFHKMVEQENGAIRNATLTAVEQLKKENSAVHTDIKTGLAALRITERNTEELINETGRMHTYLQSKSTLSSLLCSGFSITFKIKKLLLNANVFWTICRHSISMTNREMYLESIIRALVNGCWETTSSENGAAATIILFFGALEFVRLLQNIWS